MVAFSAILFLPLCGVLAAGRPIGPYLEFPPRPRFVMHASFSWPVFFALAACITTAIVPFVSRLLKKTPSSNGPPRITNDASRATSFLPWWGWVGMIWTALSWMVAWNRWEWIGEWQLHTFAPLWLGYITVINALTVCRTGTSVMLRHPGPFLLLFPLSAVFWWTFEYLNRFVQNWHYAGGREFSSGEYFVLATVPFSTVLPAVISTADWLSTYPRLSAGLEGGAWAVPILRSKPAGWSMVLGSAGGLVGIGLWPDYLFPLVWLAPLLFITGLQLVSGEATVFDRAAQGDWRLLWVAALAALMCGFFWELWNSRSLAHWEYVIPFTHRFQVFEMPLLGYAGYLPFGLECLVVVQLFIPADWIHLSAQDEARSAANAHASRMFERCLNEPS